MDRRVFKYPLKNRDDHQEVIMPSGADILTVQMQRGMPCLWAMVDQSQPLSCARKIRIVGTGHPVSDDENLRYIGTVQMQGGALILHVFEQNDLEVNNG